jgi:hypothetical protein
MDTFAHYLFGLGNILKTEALDIKRERSNAVSTERAFWDGKLLAYNEVLSLMLSQATAFEIDPRSLGLEGFDPDNDL